MIHTTHILFGILLTLISFKEIPALGSLTPFDHSMLLAALGALVADLDHPNGYLSRGNWRFLSMGVRTTTSHRGWTHSIFGAFFFTVFAGAASWYYVNSLFYIVPFTIGYLSHLISDSLNPTGVNWLWPKKDKYKINLVKTGGKGEAVFQGLVSLGIAGLLAGGMFLR